MASSNNKPSSKSQSSSFDAFSKVDDLVSKPVLGSDGAASWQSFQNDHRANNCYRRSTGPRAPLKKAVKLGSGFSTWDEERAHESRIRKESGHAKTNAGYSEINNTKEKNDKEISNRKRRSRLDARIRPNDQEYFIPSKTFKGWKFDYVFTTRNSPGTTGYFWDGMDSMKQANGELEYATKTNPASTSAKVMDDNASSNPPSKKKRKTKKRGPVFVHDPNNPVEQMQTILQRRNQNLTGIIDDHNLKIGWETAKDPSTGTMYYFHRLSGNRSWQKPSASKKSVADGKNETNFDELQTGWKSTVDKLSGKKYYYHTTGETTWTKPESR